MSQITEALAATTHQISVEAARALITNYQNNLDNLINGAFKNDNPLGKSESFNAEILNSILGQDECIGARIYFGMQEDHRVVFVLCGIDQDGNDYHLALGTNEPSVLAQDGVACPPKCPEASRINS